MLFAVAVVVICSVECLQLDSQASTRRPRVTKYSKTTAAPGGSTDANTFVPNNANVAGTCKEGDAETLVLSFKEFSLELSFAKTPGGERWYVDSIRLTYNSSARILEHAAKQGRKVTLSTDSRSLLFPTPVGKSYYCPEETVVELVENDPSATSVTAHRAKLYLRQMRLQAFMYKRGGQFGPAWHCASGAPRSEAAPVAVGAALALATAATLLAYALWRYFKVHKVHYDTME
ncbi:hypothetical protein ACJJTC_012930 [Scirpophaga incertulas]